MKLLSAYQEQAVNKFISLLPANSKSILEIGSDVDYLVVDNLSNRFNGKIIGINPTPGFVKREPADGPANVTIMEANGCNQPFENFSFDAIISIATMEHVLDVPGFLRECRRVLKPGGIFYTNFGPIWSSGIGHHVCAFAGRKEARFWKPGCNPLPNFSHLVWNEDEMRNYLLDSPYDDRLIEPIIQWVYHSDHINRLFFEDYMDAMKNCRMDAAEFSPKKNVTPDTEKQAILSSKYGPNRSFNYSSIEFVLVRPTEPSKINNNAEVGSLANKLERNVVLNFHRGDQQSAATLLKLLLKAKEGCDSTYYLQYGDSIDTLEIKDIINDFSAQKDVVFSCDFPNVTIPDIFYLNDPNLLEYPGNHSKRTSQQKKSILQWNLCVYKYIQKLDSFLMIEPDCVILKNGWLNDIYTAFENSNFPIFGHIKKGIIANQAIATHWAGCSVYNGLELRILPLKKYFTERYENPWWPYRNLPGTSPANNAFYGPVFSGYDVSYDYLLFALYWREITCSNDPFLWPIDQLESRDDLIFCDFRSKMTADEIEKKFAGRISLLHGVKDDSIRKRMTEVFSKAEILDKSNLKLASYKDKHKGQRCVIIGNGPSLNKMDLSFLENEITFGTNRIYLLFDRLKFRPTYYTSVNPLVIEQSAHEILKIKAPKFLSNKGIMFFKNPPEDVMFIQSLPKWHFSYDPREGLCEGWTVTFFAMQLAYFMGFSEVILIGVDHYFVTQGDPNKEVVSQGTDPNHFHPDYFGKGIRWHLPDLKRSEGSYAMAKKAFEADGRRIIDATVGGKLAVFPKVDYRHYFSAKNVVPVSEAACSPNSLQVLEQAQELTDRGQINAAIKLVHKTCRLLPNDAPLHFALGLLLEKRGERRVAVSYFESAVKFAPANINYLKKLAFCYHKTCGRSGEAMSLLQKVLEIDNNDHSAYQAVAQICQSVGREDDAAYFNEIAQRLFDSVAITN